LQKKLTVGKKKPMKNKYFGDINDYLKYGLIRSILHAYKFHLLVAWMLTDPDEKNDGKFIDYLSNPRQYRCYDPELYEELQLMSKKDTRAVTLIEQTNLIPGARYFSVIVPDSSKDRISWSQELLSNAQDSDLVFLDPDNGIEVKSKPYGRKYSSKYLYWREVNGLWEQGKSLLIYQHFCREERRLFVKRIRGRLQEMAKGSKISTFATPRVVFFMALQLEHQKYHDSIVATVEKHWGAKIQLW
jgi:hypothetical protein